MRQKFITKYVRFFIRKWDSFITKCDSYYNCDNFITTCDSYYKMRLLSQIEKVQNTSNLITLNKLACETSYLIKLKSTIVSL